MLSDAAARARLRRVCQANCRGEFKVPQEVVEKFKDPKGGREDLMKQFERCAHDPDRCVFHLFQVEIPQTNFQQRVPGVPTNIYPQVGKLSWLRNCAYKSCHFPAVIPFSVPG